MTDHDATFRREDDGRHVLRFERRLRHPIARVWAGLTEPAELRGWLGEAQELDLRPGGAVAIRWLNTGDQEIVARGTITALEPPRLLEYDTASHGTLRWELREDGGGTLLTFTNVAAMPEDHVKMALAGWHIHLDHLDDALRGTPVDWPAWTPDTVAPSSGRSWRDHEGRYAAIVGGQVG